MVLTMMLALAGASTAWAASTSDGYIYQVPSGTSVHNTNLDPITYRVGTSNTIAFTTARFYTGTTLLAQSGQAAPSGTKYAAEADIDFAPYAGRAPLRIIARYFNASGKQVDASTEKRPNIRAVVEPTPSSTPSPEPEPTSTPGPEPTNSPTPTPTPEPTSTPNPTPSPTPEPTPTPSPEPEPGSTPTSTPRAPVDPDPAAEPDPVSTPSPGPSAGAPDPRALPSPSPSQNATPQPEPAPSSHPEPEPPTTANPAPDPQDLPDPTPGPQAPATPQEPETSTLTTVSGRGGADLSLAVSRVSHGDRSAAVVVLASARVAADSVAGSRYAAALGAPLLLVDPERLGAPSAVEITRVSAAGSRIVALGGPAAISPAVLEEVANATGSPVQRLAGRDRYATAATIAGALGQERAAPVFLTDGSTFADALSVTSLAAARGGVVLLSDGSRIPAATADYLSAYPEASVTAVGGRAAASAPGAPSIVGADRYATSRAVLDLLGPTEALGMASGRDWAGALVGAATMARTGAGLLLLDVEDGAAIGPAAVGAALNGRVASVTTFSS